MGLQIDCLAWSRVPGVAGHLDHLLLAAAQTQNDTGCSPASNLADMLSRPAADYFTAIRPIYPHQNYCPSTRAPEQCGLLLRVVG